MINELERFSLITSIEDRLFKIRTEAEKTDIISKTAEVYCYSKESRDSFDWGIAELANETAQKSAQKIMQQLDELKGLINQMLAEDTGGEHE